MKSFLPQVFLTPIVCSTLWPQFLPRLVCLLLVTHFKSVDKSLQDTAKSSPSPSPTLSKGSSKGRAGAPAKVSEQAAVPPKVLYQPDSNPHGRVGATEVVLTGKSGGPEPAVVPQSSSQAAFPPEPAVVAQCSSQAASPPERSLMNLVLRKQKIQEMLPSSISLSFMVQLVQSKPCFFNFLG